MKTSRFNADIYISLQSHGSDHSLHDRMQTIESQLAAITAASGITGTCADTQTSASAASFSAYPIPPADYVVYDHTTESTYSYYPTYNVSTSL